MSVPTTGYSRAAPAGLGIGIAVKFTDDNSYGETYGDAVEARITVLEVIRGQGADEPVVNPHGDCLTCSPMPGFERLLVRIRFELLKVEGPDKAYSLQKHRWGRVEEFEAVSFDGKVYEHVNYGVRFDDREDMEVELYSGATHEGWKVFHVAQHEGKPLMGFKYGGWWKLHQ